MTKKKRDKNLDMFKGLCILCIVFLHIENGILPRDISVFVGYFMITGFYMSSAMVWARRTELTLSEYLTYRRNTLLLPYLYWSIIIVLFDVLLFISGLQEGRHIFVDVYKALTLRGIGTLWFIPALVLGELSLLVYRSYIGKFKTLFCLILLTSLVILNYTKSSVTADNLLLISVLVTLHNMIEASIILILFYSLFKQLNKATIDILRMPHLSWMTLFFVFVFWIVPEVNSVVIELKSLILHLLSPFFVYVLLSKYLVHNRFAEYLTFASKNSLLIMCSHYSLLLSGIILVFQKFSDVDFSQGLPSVFLFLVVMCSQHLLIYYVNGRLPWLIGK